MAAHAIRLFAIIITVVGLSAPAAAQEKPTLVVTLNTADVQTSQSAFDFARQIQHGNGQVVVYLNADAVRLASRRAPQPVGAVSRKTSHDFIAEIVADGGRVFVCAVCMQQSGLAMRDRVDNVKLGGQEFRDIVMAPNTRILGF